MCISLHQNNGGPGVSPRNVYRDVFEKKGAIVTDRQRVCFIYSFIYTLFFYKNQIMSLEPHDS